jgi:hypothetical protein
MDRPVSQRKARRIRHDGWTPKRQLDFLAALARSRSVTKAARAVGMSRESAYRLRARLGPRARRSRTHQLRAATSQRNVTDFPRKSAKDDEVEEVHDP